jgi:CheY-like chemotaxis protein
MPPHQHAALVVEDNADIRDGVTTLLRWWGHRVVPAGSGHAALTMLRDGFRPCVIFLDLCLPDMSGAAFRQAQLADPVLTPIPVVVVSAGDKDREAAMYALGIRAFIRKPMGGETLLRALDEYCSQRLF